jgi:hypothetical protein|nr:MAG TPA: hypothetical protein [Bacteriophage sp.]
MNFKEYDETIKKHKYDMLSMIIYYNLQCNEDFKNLKENDIIMLIQFICKAYLKDESHIDLGYMCDKALENKKEILKNDVNVFNTWYLLEACYE